MELHAPTHRLLAHYSVFKWRPESHVCPAVSSKGIFRLINVIQFFFFSCCLLSKSTRKISSTISWMRTVYQLNPRIGSDSPLSIENQGIRNNYYIPMPSHWKKNPLSRFQEEKEKSTITFLAFCHLTMMLQWSQKNNLRALTIGQNWLIWPVSSNQ